MRMTSTDSFQVAGVLTSVWNRPGSLAEPMEITGRVRARLYVSTDAVDGDVMVRLSDVYPDGRSMLITDAPLRLSMRHGLDRIDPVAPGDVMAIDVDLWSTSIVLAAGHHLRVSVSGSNAPRFWPSPADGSSYGDPGATPTTAEMTVHHSAAYPSYLELPDPSRDASEVVDCGGPDPVDGGVPGRDGGTAGDAGMPERGGAGDGGCGCATSRGATGSALPLLAVLLWLGARRLRAGPG